MIRHNSSPIRHHSPAAADRRGAVVVELALVASFLSILLLGMCEVGQALRVEAVLAQAARKGCAAGSRPGAGNADVVYDVRNALAAAGFPAQAATITILVNDRAGNVAQAKRNDKITVSISIPKAEVAWARSNVFMGRTAVQSEAMNMLKQG